LFWRAALSGAGWRRRRPESPSSPRSRSWTLVTRWSRCRTSCVLHTYTNYYSYTTYKSIPTYYYYYSDRHRHEVRPQCGSLAIGPWVINIYLHKMVRKAM
jgi:hypothetical protein